MLIVLESEGTLLKIESFEGILERLPNMFYLVFLRVIFASSEKGWIWKWMFSVLLFSKLVLSVKGLIEFE